MTNSGRGWRDHPLVQLTLVRYREFYREPEAIFWVFIFPVLLTAGLGLAFRSRPPERTPVALVSRGAVDDSLAPRLADADGIKIRALTDSAADDMWFIVNQCGVGTTGPVVFRDCKVDWTGSRFAQAKLSLAAAKCSRTSR